MFLAWKNKKIMLFLSTWNDTGMIDSKILRGSIEINIRKPNIIANYTNSMGSVDQYYDQAFINVF